MAFLSCLAWLYVAGRYVRAPARSDPGGISVEFSDCFVDWIFFLQAVAGRADADDPVWSPREELRQCADLSPSPPTSRFFFPLDLSVRVMVSPKLQLPKVLSVEDKLRNLGCM